MMRTTVNIFNTLLCFTSPFVTNGLFVENGECSQVLTKKSSWGSGAEYRTSFNSLDNPDWKITLSFDNQLASIEAADGIITTKDLKNIEIRPKYYFKSAPDGTAFDMLVKYINGQKANLNEVNLNGNTYRCNVRVQDQGAKKSVFKNIPAQIEAVKVPAPAEGVHVLVVENSGPLDVLCGGGEAGCANKKSRFNSEIHCKKESGKPIGCTLIEITTTHQKTNCPADKWDKQYCDALKDDKLCSHESFSKSTRKILNDNCFFTCWCA